MSNHPEADRRQTEEDRRADERRFGREMRSPENRRQEDGDWPYFEKRTEAERRADDDRRDAERRSGEERRHDED